MNTIVGKNLELFRNVSGYQQNEVAKYLNVEQGIYTDYENGNNEMPYDLLVRVTELYGIALSSFFEKNPSDIENNLVCSFRIDEVGIEDIKEISHFKNVVRNYLKMCTY
ncbi:MAG: helix-turn-helix domain-containing protein [Mediterranea sp.]|nr:helix-turn-helix domain-containing protein [Mediterranea sp.]